MYAKIPTACVVFTNIASIHEQTHPLQFQRDCVKSLNTLYQRSGKQWFPSLVSLPVFSDCVVDLHKNNEKMDPLSMAGIGLGAVSLTIQIFSGCVEGSVMPEIMLLV